MKQTKDRGGKERNVVRWATAGTSYYEGSEMEREEREAEREGGREGGGGSRSDLSLERF